MPAGSNPASAVSRVRLKRQWMGLVSYLMFLPVLVVSVEFGWVDFGYRGLLGFTLAAFGTNLAFYAAIRSGRTAHLRDPSLLFWQIAIAMALAVLMGYFAREAQIITLALFFAAFFFGVFDLRTREYLTLTAAAAVGYAIMLAIKYPPAQRGSEAFHVELLHYGVLVMILLWISLLGSYVSRLRARLVDKRDALSQALERLQTLASHDELTGVFNRRRLMEMLDQQRERALRHGERFSICLFDLDHFKQLNDRYGHQVGDEALRGFSAHIDSGIRRIDVFGHAGEAGTPGVFGRYGGEEFLLLLPHTGLDDAVRCVERLRGSMHGAGFETAAGPVTLTFSAGVAQYRDGETVAQLMDRADAAMYRAKREGRDRVGVAS